MPCYRIKKICLYDNIWEEIVDLRARRHFMRETGDKNALEQCNNKIKELKSEARAQEERCILGHNRGIPIVVCAAKWRPRRNSGSI